MRRSWIGSVLGVALALAFTFGAVAQSEAWRLGQTPDGALWVIANGVRHRITPVMLTDVDVSGIAEAEAWDNGVIVGAGPQPPSQPSQPSAGGPAIGTPVLVETYKTRLTVTVLQVSDAVQPTGQFATKPKGRFLVVELSVRNDGAAEDSVYGGPIHPQTADGQLFDMTIASGLPEPRFPSVALGPGQLVRGFVHYDIPAGVPIKRLVYTSIARPMVTIAELP